MYSAVTLIGPILLIVSDIFKDVIYDNVYKGVQFNGKVVNGSKDSDKFNLDWSKPTKDFLSTHGFDGGFIELIQNNGESFKDGMKQLHAFKCKEDGIEHQTFNVGEFIGEFIPVGEREKVQFTLNSSERNVGVQFITRTTLSNYKTICYLPLMTWKHITYPIEYSTLVEDVVEMVRKYTTILLPDITYFLKTVPEWKKINGVTNKWVKHFKIRKGTIEVRECKENETPKF